MGRFDALWLHRDGARPLYGIHLADDLLILRPERNARQRHYRLTAEQLAQLREALRLVEPPAAVGSPVPG